MKASNSLLSLLLLRHAAGQSSGNADSNNVNASLAPQPEGEYTCQHPPYKIQLVSSSPLVLYIRDFLTEAERAHLKSIRYLQLSFSLPRPRIPHDTNTTTSTVHRRPSIRPQGQDHQPPPSPPAPP